jgi:hypothetical protein
MRFTSSGLFIGIVVFACQMAPASAFAQATCGALPPPAGNVIEVSAAQAASLPSVVRAARPGDTIQLADGTYLLPQSLVFDQPGVTIRSKSGNRNAVILDGQYAVGELVVVLESNVTVADLTLMRAYYHPVHVSAQWHTTSGTLIHNVRAVDGAEQFIKINPDNGYYTDYGVVRCSSLEMTDAGRAHVRNNCYTGGIDAHQALGWQVYLNTFSGFWCDRGISEHAIHFWVGSRDTVIDRNVIVNSARGVGLGLEENRPSRIYPDQPCNGKLSIGHYGGSITNTIVFANDARLFASSAGFDAGIALEQSCATNVLHNTVVSTSPPFSSIEWRWPHTLAAIANNIVSHNLRERDGGVAMLAANLENAPASLFVDAVATGDLHLRPTATAAIDQGATLASPVAWDIDGAPRGSRPDIGADELIGGTPPPAGACTPSPAGTRGSAVCDASGAQWTLASNGATLRNGVHSGSGFGSVYSWQTVNIVLTLSTLGQDNAWWSWNGSGWVFAGVAEPGATPSGCAVSPAGTRGSEICDSNGARWTLGAQGQTLRNGTHSGFGYGSVFSWQSVNGVLTLSTLGQDNAWWSWIGSGWVSAGASEPGAMPSSCATSTAGTRGNQVCDSNGNVWTLGPSGGTLRNGAHTGFGYGSVYSWQILNGVLTLSTLGQDNAWWSWNGDAWKPAGAAEPGTE